MTDKQKQKLDELLKLKEAEERDQRDFLKRVRKERDLVLKTLGVADVKEEQNNNSDFYTKYENLKSSVDDLLSLIYSNYNGDTEARLQEYIAFRKKKEEEKQNKAYAYQ